MFTRFEPTKSTKGASKMRRDLINAEIANLRDLLPLPPSTRQRLSQLQLMALICVYVRKANYFQQVLKCHDFTHHYHHHSPTPNIGFSKAMSGFLMMMTQNGKLLYISDNAAEYLGHSMEDLLIHGDSVYDIIDKQDHQAVQAELCRNTSSASPGSSSSPKESRMFLCRINVARNARRQMRFGDQKVVLVKGHFLSFLPLCSRNEPVFLAACAPLAMPETRECVVQGATNVFTTIHSMDMKIKHIDKNGEWYLGWEKSEIQGVSWYQLLHWECMKEAQSKHRLITQSEQERSCILLLRLQKHSGDWLWVHAVLQVKDNMENNQQPVIVCTNQVLSDAEAAIMLSNSWLYHYYSVQSKLQYGMAYDTQLQNYYHPSLATYSPSPYAINQESPYSQHSNEEMNHHMMGASEHQHHDVHTVVHNTRQHTPTVLRHSGGHIMAINHQGYGFESSMAERGPVDYSRHSSSFTPDTERYIPQSEVIMRGIEPSAGEPPPSIRHHRKRKHSTETLTRLEPLHIAASKQSHVIVDGGGGTLLALTHPTDRHPKQHHHQPKNGPAAEDPADFMDRWNPSPPWSDTALQKAPSSSQGYHEAIGSYASPAPLTPTPTPGVLAGYGSGSFTFDWLPEHYGMPPQPVLHVVCGRNGDDDYNNNPDARQKLQHPEDAATVANAEGNVEAS